MDILTNPLRDLTLGELAVILSRSERPEDLAARLAREANVEQARRIYEAALDRAKDAQIAAAPDSEWSENVGTSTVIVQPVHPKGALLEPAELRARLIEFRASGDERFPALINEETIPGGLLFVHSSSLTGAQRQCQQLLSNGLLFDKHEATWKNGNTGIVSLYLQDTAKRLAAVLSFASKYFPMLSYETNLACAVMLDDLNGCLVPPLAEERDFLQARRNPPRQALLSSYRFEATLNATDLRDPGALHEFCVALVEQVCWGLGTWAQPDLLHATVSRAGLAAPSP